MPVVGGCWPRRVARHALLSATLWSASLITFFPAVGSAGLCGDDVSGKRVACACGDVVVSDTRLLATDPIVAARCPLDGLIIRASRLAESITLDLGGHALVGRGYGSGIRIDDGGSDGAAVVGGAGEQRGEIVGFGTGVKSPRPQALRRLERIDVKGSRHDGFDVRTSGALLVDVTASDNGGNGVRFSGEGGHLLGVVAVGNADSGIVVRSRQAVIDARADDNGRHGIICDGGANDLSGVVTRNNGGHGALIRGGGQRIAGIRAEHNALEDVRMPAKRVRR